MFALFHRLHVQFSLGLLTCLIAAPASADDVLRDGDIAIDETEFREVLDSLPRSIVEKAAQDNGDRFELINQLLMARKLAAEADRMTPQDEGYWPLHFKLIDAKKNARFDQLVAQAMSADEPALEALARERYATLKDEFAKVPETRASSHILLASPPGLDRTEVREKAARLLAELRAGASFSEYVEKYSQDPGSKRRAGSLGRSIRFGQDGITPPYSEALFEIEKVGDYSEVTDSPFGVHIIRLDGIEPSRYLEFDEVRADIIAAIRREQQQLAIREVRARYLISDEAYIDGAAMEALFAPFKE